MRVPDPGSSPKARMSAVKWLALVVLLAAAGRLVAVTVGRRAPPQPRYRTVAVERGDIHSTVSATGTLNAVTTVHVGSQLSGIIQSLNADFNTEVRRGQLLAQIDPATYQATVEQAQADVEAALASVEAARTDTQAQAAILDELRASQLSAAAQLRRAQVTAGDREAAWRRTRDLSARKLASQQDMETATSNRDAALADSEAASAGVTMAGAKVRTAQAQGATGASKVKVAQAQLSQRRAALALARVSLERTRVFSPIDGVVTHRNVEVGQTVAASFQTPTLFVIANNLKLMQIDANVDEADIGKVKVGQVVDFTVDAHPDEKFQGKVVQIRLQPVVSQNVVSYDTIVHVDNPGLLLMCGMTANLKIRVGDATNVLKIPAAAFSFKMEGPSAVPSTRSESASTPTTAAARGARVVHRLVGTKVDSVDLTVGLSDGNHAALVSGPVAKGDLLVLGLAVDDPDEAAGSTHPFAISRKK